ncbi:ATP synthase F1 subunit epsilon [Ruminococcus sp. Marseille-P6503]|uniref:ATP synthase F1 subunit epsilon n=1 Tax=Ruminococcus sp. Marseille-P6503 TaxID=2364796 RepID=UPI000F531548|nr:ATP synthase F1 subunit epsilon [Ruminococcus sp. Marseille-P6503]
MRNFRLKIITPEKVFFDGEVRQITARTPAGNIGILAGHTPYAANIIPSPLRIFSGDGACRTAAVSRGIIKAEREKVTIAAEAVEWSEEIDVDRAERAREAAQKKLDNYNSQMEFDRAEQKLKRALNRLTVAGKY